MERLRFLGVIVFLLIFPVLFLFMAGCDNGGTESQSSVAERVSDSTVDSSSLQNAAVGTKSRQTVYLHVSPKSGLVEVSYPDSSGKLNKRSSFKMYSKPAEVEVVTGDTGWDSVNKIFSMNISLKNNSTDTFYGAYASITSVTTDTVSVLNENGYDESGNPFFNHAPGGEKISASGTGSEVQWQFHDPEAAAFDITSEIYADNWHPIAGPATSFSWDSNAEDATDSVDNDWLPTLIPYNGNVFAVVGKQTHSNRDETSNPISGAEVWEYDTTGETWTQVNSDGWVDLNPSEGHKDKIFNNWGGGSVVYHGNLYVGGGVMPFLGGRIGPEHNGPHIYRYNGSSWTDVFNDTEVGGVNTLFEFNNNIFYGSLFAGYGKAYSTTGHPPIQGDGNMYYSTTGNLENWNLVFTDAFGEVDRNGNAVGSTLVDGGTLSLGGKTLAYVGKGGLGRKPGFSLFMTDTSGTAGAEEPDWVRAAGNVDTTASGDDELRTIATISNYGDNLYKVTLTGAALTPHKYAHHYAEVHIGATTLDIFTVIDNTASFLIIGNQDFQGGDPTPDVDDTITLTSGRNERGIGDTGNATSASLIPFAPSSEGSAGSAEQLWVVTSNLPQGLTSYQSTGAQMSSLKSMSNDKSVNLHSSDSDWVRRMDYFSATTELGFATPSSAGGLNKGGTVISPVRAFAGFDIEGADSGLVNVRDEFTATPVIHNGWMYVEIYGNQRVEDGFRMFKSADGVNWITVTTDGFGAGPYRNMKALTSNNGKLYGGVSRYAFTGSISSSPTAKSAITPSTNVFYQKGGTFPAVSLVYPDSGTILSEAWYGDAGTEPILEADVVVEKFTYTSNKIATSATLGANLPANNGYLARTLWASDTEIVLNDFPTNLGLHDTKGAVNIESEVINYDSVSGSTLQTLTDRSFLISPEYKGAANHTAGSTVYRTTRGVTAQGSSFIAARELERLDGDGTIYSIPISGDASLLNTSKLTGMALAILGEEEIKYQVYNGVTAPGPGLRTPLRGFDSTTVSAHTAGEAFYKPGFDGVTRGALGTTATNWNSGEDVSPISLDPVEVWVTD